MHARRALVLLLPGLGDAMMATPALRALRESGAFTSADALAMLPAVAEYARGSGLFDDVTLVEMLALGPAAVAARLLPLRARRYDLVVLPYPAVKWQYHAVARVIGARRVLTHAYPSNRFVYAGMRATRVPLRPVHNIEQNLALTGADGGPADRSYTVPPAWLAGDVPRERVVAFHAGTMKYHGNDGKRWPLEHFVALGRRLQGEGVGVAFVIGPNEEEDWERLPPDVRAGFGEIRGDLDAVARRLRSALALVSNDSGVAHVGAALGLPTLVLYGMTDPRLLQPPSPSTIALRPSACPPCYSPARTTFSCVRGIGFRCIREDLGVDEVRRALEHAIAPRAAR
ncbi:MAG TPA: glycosyltransferase family 9 protein [Candidatus Baltobacteraceae bacterium]|nr:glycosyltransferase family 9 protein [Candidatus Baltobacteraceae bacterium]